MERCDALIVGGGPAGSACAWQLRRAGWNVAVLDRAQFPRDKVCAGWITPGIFDLLDLAPAEYRATGLTFQEIRGFRTGVLGGRMLETSYAAPVSYAIRRCEFDDFLLRRSGARVLDPAPLAGLERRADRWIVNGRIETPVVVGAGGHFCPVARRLRGGVEVGRPVVAKEVEFRLDGAPSNVSAAVPELFFSHDLEGYGWCVRKGEFLNVGLGRRDKARFAEHLRAFLAFLVGSGRAPEDIAARPWRGHAYHARGAGLRWPIAEGALLVGDAAGLAYPESGEGIKPAVDSGRLAAETLIAAAGRVGVDALAPYAKALRARYPGPAAAPPALQPLVKTAGRLLLQHSRAFTRRIVIDRWFLRAAAPAR